MEDEEEDNGFADIEESNPYDNVPAPTDNRHAMYLPSRESITLTDHKWRENLERLRICSTFLLAEIDAKDLMNLMYEKKALTYDDLDEIKNTNPATRKTRNRTLLRKIFQGNPSGYDIFVDVLKQCGYSIVADKLTATPVDIPDDPDFSQTQHLPLQLQDSRNRYHSSFDFKRKNRHDQLLQVLNADTNLFVETCAFKKAQHVIGEFRHVALTGGPGEGKSLMSHQLVLDQQRKGYIPLIVKEMRDLEFWSPKKNTVILCEDIFGRSTLHTAANLDIAKDILDKFVAHWKNEQKNGIKMQNTKLRLILTSRNYLLKEACMKFKSSQLFVLEGDSVLDLTQTYSLSADERLNILNRHLHCHECQMKDDLMESIITKTSKIIGFPECCRLFTDAKVFDDIKSNAIDFFVKPVDFLVGFIEDLFIEKENYKAVFYLLIFRNGTIFRPDINSDLNFLKKIKIGISTLRRKDIDDAIYYLCMCFLMSEEYTITARHPSIFETVAYVVGSHSPEFVINYCSLDFIYQHVQLCNESLKTRRDSDRWFLIEVPEEGFKMLAVRFAKAIRGDIDQSLVCCHQACSNKKFVDIFLKAIMEKTKPLDRLSLIITKLSKMSLNDNLNKAEEFLYWATWNENEILCKQFLHHVSFKPDQLVKALYGATISGNTEAFKLLYRELPLATAQNLLHLTHSGIECVPLPMNATQNPARIKETINEPLICIAAKYRKTEVLRTMKKEGFLLDVKGKNGMTPLHYVCSSGDLDSAKFLIAEGASLTALRMNAIPAQTVNNIPLAMITDDSMKIQLAKDVNANLLQELHLMLSKFNELRAEVFSEETAREVDQVLQQVFNHHVCSREAIAKLMYDDSFIENILLWLKRQPSPNKSETHVCAAHLLDSLDLYVPVFPKLIEPFRMPEVPEILSRFLSKCEFLDECIIRLLWSMHTTEAGGYFLQEDIGIDILLETAACCKEAWTKAKAMATCGVSIHNYTVHDRLNSEIEGELECFWWLLAWVFEGEKSEDKTVNIGCYMSKWFVSVTDILKSLSWLSLTDATRKQLSSMGAIAVIVYALEHGNVADKREAVICLQRLAFDGKIYDFFIKSLGPDLKYANTMSMRHGITKPGSLKEELSIENSHISMLHGFCVYLMTSSTRQTLSDLSKQTLMYLLQMNDAETNVLAAFIYKRIYSGCFKAYLNYVAYFHGNLSCDDADSLLKGRPVGVFLLRLSPTSDDQLTLSYNTDENNSTNHLSLDDHFKDLLLTNHSDELREKLSKLETSCHLTMPLNWSPSQYMGSVLLKWIVTASKETSLVHTDVVGGVEVKLALVHLKSLLRMLALIETSEQIMILDGGGLEVMISLLSSEDDLSEFSVFHSDDALELIVSQLKQVAEGKLRDYILSVHFQVKLTLWQLLLAFSSFHLETNQRLNILEEDILQVLANILQKKDVGNDVLLVCMTIVQNLCSFTDCHNDLSNEKNLLTALQKCIQNSSSEVRTKAEKTAELLKKLP